MNISSNFSWRILFQAACLLIWGSAPVLIHAAPMVGSQTQSDPAANSTDSSSTDSSETDSGPNSSIAKRALSSDTDQGTAAQAPATQEPSDESTDQGLGFPTSMQRAARAVRASTVTIRVDRNLPLADSEPSDEAESGQEPGDPSRDNDRQPRRSVAVFSGVLVKQGFVVTPLFLPHPKRPEVRITLPDGEQTIGRPRILDEYSGLAIISINDHAIPCLKCCASSEPAVGDWVVSGAAWGREEALVSLGMISGIGYRLPHSTIEPPPMIVCDLRVAQTSKGAGVVGANGKLVGIVMAVSNDRKWTYVVPASHIDRLLRSLALHESRPGSSSDDILVLKREVPRLGVRIENCNRNEDLETYDVVVKAIASNSPAEQAGLVVEDQIKSVNGKVVRAWIDIARDLRIRQPGDEIELGIIRDGASQTLSVVLGGGFATPADKIEKLKDYIQPEIDRDDPSKSTGRWTDSQLATNPLINYSNQNLAPAPCGDSAAIERLTDALQVERQQNAELRSKLEVLESRLNLLIEKLEK